MACISPIEDYSFKKFPKLEQLSKSRVRITQKIDGTNGCLIVTPDNELIACSKNRVLSEKCDNFGFYAWAMTNKSILTQFLGHGRHFGEWAGVGIQNGEGLTMRKFVLFEYWKYKGQELPLTSLAIVPFVEEISLDELSNTDKLEKLRKSLENQGSLLSPGFKPVEGLVLQIGNQSYKYRFDRL